MSFRQWLCVYVAVCLTVFSNTPAQSQDWVWMEGESAVVTGAKPNISGWGNAQFLSEKKWLQISVDEGKIDADVPEKGISLRYRFQTSKPGSYAIWNRIGYEFVRSPFEWRVDDGAWKQITPDMLTTDLMALQDWTEVAWLKMGEVPLTVGTHQLEIRLSKRKGVQRKWERVLYASDALCISRTPFHPYSHYKPGQDWRNADDRRAAQQVFNVPTVAEPNRVSVALKGLWEVCRHDENLPTEVAAPIKDFPKKPYWKAIAVPNDKMKNAELTLAHRLWYRTRVNVPASLVGRSVQIEFPQNNLNTTVYVNGIYCGFQKNPFARFSIDITKGVKAGVNEIWVGIKDAYYGRSVNAKDPMKLRRTFNIPLRYSTEGFQDLAYPIWNHFQSGILFTPTLHIGGAVYVADVFVQPSVQQKKLKLDVTLTNTTAKAVNGTYQVNVNSKNQGSDETEWATSMPFALTAGETRTFRVEKEWLNPKLWWTDSPHLYALQSRVMVGQKSLDTHSQTFGFREWTVKGTQFFLNGVAYQSWCDQHAHSSKEEWLAFQRKSNQNIMRFWGMEWHGMSPNDALSWFDTNGVVVRRSGLLDGQRIGYWAIENDPLLRDLYKSEIKMELMQNWKEQMVAQVKAERNHPSVMVWSLENEWLYINCINLYGNKMDEFEAEVKKVSDAVLKADPTRTTMTDGGGANKDNSMPVHGNHYVAELDALWKYPALAYSDNVTGGGRGRWIWNKQQPRFLGEDYFIAGSHPELSTLGGEAVFAGKSAQLPSAGLMARILNEGYRWAGVASWDLWMGHTDADGSQYNALSHRAVLCRNWDWSFASGEVVQREFGIFNATRFPDPITFSWRMTIGRQEAFGGNVTHNVAPGTDKRWTKEFIVPNVGRRTEAELILTLNVGDALVYKDVKAVSLLPEPAFAGVQNKNIAVFDPEGSAREYLTKNNVSFSVLQNLANLPQEARVLLIGRNALTLAESASSKLAAYAASGRTVILLEQQHPLKYQGLPAEMEAEENEGRVAFAEDLSHPVLIGLEQKDFFTWNADEIVYRNAYRKPTRGAKSLIQCHQSLQSSALAEVPVGEGLILLCQLVVQQKLQTNIVARTLFANLLNFGANYRREYRQVAAVLPEGTPFQRTTDAIGVDYSRTQDPLQAISKSGGLAIIAATPANLKTLAQNADRVKAFTEGGGWIFFSGLTPEGLQDYNRIVGYDHAIRPGKRERVTFPAVRHPLSAGITTGDITLYSSQRIFDFQEGNYVVTDGFNYLLDIEDVAPFGKSSFFAYDNITNNFFSADGWPLIINFEINKDNSPFNVPITLPKQEVLTEFTWVGNTFYYPQTKVALVMEDESGKTERVEFAVQPNTEPQTFAINPPKPAKKVTLQIVEWQTKPDARPLIGIDNIYLKAQRPPDFSERVKPLVSNGGIIAYPKGKGGILFCNLNFKDSEDLPETHAKKRSIYANLLRNLKAPFKGGNSVIAGTNLRYTPIDISKQANQYRDERGWFGDKNFTFRDLPKGRQTFAGVNYEIFDFPTSPVPTAIMLGGNGIPNNPAEEVKGIPVARKADALFFLLSARIDRRLNPDEKRKNQKLEMAKIVVRYADGQTAEIPFHSEWDVDDFKQPTPKPLPGAQIAWTKPFTANNDSAVAYSKQWDNPRPGVVIQSLDFKYGKDRSGVPVLLAVTAASAN